MDLEYIDGCRGRGLSRKSCNIGHYCQLNTYDYLADIPENSRLTDIVEVQFKNTRKGYYHNINNLPLEKGDIVAVEANPGHDIGTVTLTGKLALLQMKKANLKSLDEVRNIYRKAKPVDMEKFAEAKEREHDTMIRSRQIAKDLGLEMKIGDVEYQGDGNKAIFYYIADGRVDFRQLIKVLAEAFRVRIEMKQIGARQEAGRIGGFGPCGRELCCASWMKSFVSVNTGAARFQDLSLNPQKLAGQCAKLKCCMNYEVDLYVEASRKLPSREMVLQTQDGEFYLFKTDILAGMVTYSSDRRMAVNLTTITAERAMAVIAMNKEGEKPVSLQSETVVTESGVVDLATQEDMNRFDKKKKKKKNKSKGENRHAAQSGDAGQSGKETAQREEKPNAEQPKRAKGQKDGNKKGGDRRPRRDRKDNTSQNGKTQETGQA
ncbi:MAG: regulatory iron-sulfur-containing complex subunit RicT [Bacteroidaceae bacterium]|nr:regulatory iron-sulfur-containing complex subunit RicT [Bacteroidaceae bacterium]